MAIDWQKNVGEMLRRLKILSSNQVLVGEYLSCLQSPVHWCPCTAVWWDRLWVKRWDSCIPDEAQASRRGVQRSSEIEVQGLLLLQHVLLICHPKRQHQNNLYKYVTTFGSSYYKCLWRHFKIKKITLTAIKATLIGAAKTTATR